MQPEINEAYIRQFAEVLFTPPGSYPQEADIDSELEEAAAQELPSNQPLIELRLDQLIHEVQYVCSVPQNLLEPSSGCFTLCLA